MADLRHWTREFFTDFIELYRSFPCLWQVKSKEYSNREKKNEAYAALVNKYKEVDPNATKELVTKKINSFRTVHRKETAKIKASMHSGAGTEELYKPSLWYYALLSFLNSEDQLPRKSRSNIADSEKKNGREGSPPQTEQRVIRPPHKRSLPDDENKPEKNRFSDAAFKRLRSPCSESKAIAKVWALEFSKLKPDQQLYAKKAVDDVLFEARMGNLHRHAVIIKPTQVYSSPSLSPYSTQPSLHSDCPSPVPAVEQLIKQ